MATQAPSARSIPVKNRETTWTGDTRPSQPMLSSEYQTRRGLILVQELVKCGYCEGTGRIRRYDCSICDAKGQVWLTKPNVGCAYCNASGTVIGGSCGVCQGIGRVPIKEPHVKCHACDGGGRRPTGGRCRGCDGKGRVPVDQIKNYGN